MVFLYIMNGICISILQNTFAPEAATLSNVYDLNPVEINMTSFIHMIGNFYILFHKIISYNHK